MKMSSGIRLNLRLQNFVTGFLLVTLLGGIAFATHRYQIRWDLTVGNRHTLAEQSVKAVKSFEQELVATVYVQEKGEQRTQAQEILEKYRVENPQFTLRYLDPDLDPTAARKDEIALYGTVVLRSGDKREKVTELTEEKITNALIRLAKGGEKTIAFVTGHGEHSVTGAADAAQVQAARDGSDRGGYGQAVSLMKGEGYKVEPLNLAAVEKIPDPVAVTVLAGNRKPLLPVEVERLTQWLDKGGRLLILSDPETKSGLEPVLASHGVQFLGGVVIDPVARLFGGGPTTPLVAVFDKDHPITKPLTMAAFLPEAQGMGLTEVAAKEGETPVKPVKLLQGAEQGWLENSSLAGGSAAFDEATDTKGPLLLGVAVESGKRRIVAVGDSDFAANAYIDFSGNSDLFLNMVRWLAEDEGFIAIKPKPVQDSGLQMSATAGSLFSWGFVVLVPGLLLATGIAIWARRKRR